MPKFEMDEEVIWDATIGGTYPIFTESVVFGIKESHFDDKVTYAIYTKEMGFCRLVDEEDLIKKDDFDE